MRIDTIKKRLTPTFGEGNVTVSKYHGLTTIEIIAKKIISQQEFITRCDIETKSLSLLKGITFNTGYNEDGEKYVRLFFQIILV